MLRRYPHLAQMLSYLGGCTWAMQRHFLHTMATPTLKGSLTTQRGINFTRYGAKSLVGMRTLESALRCIGDAR
jgi:hypothetical protein